VSELGPHHAAVSMRPGDLSPDDTGVGLTAISKESPSRYATHPANLPCGRVDISHAPINIRSISAKHMAGVESLTFPRRTWKVSASLNPKDCAPAYLAASFVPTPSI
jgi:hypothetical protein